jgi:hypothetical membrane protein
MSHTVMMTLGGFALLAILVLIAKPTRAAAARGFIPLWLVVSIVNLLVGVLHAGYGWMEEAGVLVIVFGVPALVAFGVSRMVRG